MSIIICGAGIIGLSIAKELVKKGVDNIILLEKEKNLGKHASGRNSGVLHAGIYYSSDTLKAKFCNLGNKLMKQFCEEHKVPIFYSGKVIVCKRAEEIKVLQHLYERAKKNGVNVKLIDKKELKEIEPYAKTVEKALYSPDTAIVDPYSVLKAIEKQLLNTKKVKILKGVQFKKLIGSSQIQTSSGNFKFEIFINCAGAYADKVAHQFEIAKDYVILPFKGTYKKLSKNKSYLVRGNIYPVPDLEMPFLGIHFTKSLNGNVYIGPTAFLALGRENYKLFENIDKEIFNILFRILSLLKNQRSIRKYAINEIKKLCFDGIFKDVSKMVEGLKKEDLLPSSKAGIRPQLIDIKKKNLVMDFLVLKDSTSVHILNSISPAFTCAFPFTKYVVENYIL